MSDAPETQAEKGYRIDFASKLKEFSSPSASAYLVDFAGDRESLYALAIDSKVPHRADVLDILRLKRMNNTLMIHDSLIAYDPTAKVDRTVIIMERPDGAPLGTLAQKLSETQVIELVIKPVAHALRGYHERGVIHRGVRPNNIFLRRGSRSEVILGSCVGEPPGIYQPTEYEPLERGFAMPLGRGVGAPSTDLYALGVTALFFLSGGNDLSGKSDLEIASFKLLLGSFRALCGKRQLGLALDGFFRGTLCDDPNDRWTIEDIDNWLTGRTRRTNDGTVELQSPEAFTFAGTQFRSPRLLGLAVARRPEAAIETLKNKTIIPWSKNNIESDEIANAVASSFQHFSFESIGIGGKNDLFLMHISLALGQTGTLYFRGLSIALDGLPSVIAHAFETNNEEMIAALTRAIQQDVFTAWVNAVQRVGQINDTARKIIAAVDGTKNTMDSNRRLIKLLYALNPDQRCLSPGSVGGFVNSADRVLEALEARSDEFKSNLDVLDFHMSCFLRYSDSYYEKQIQSLELLKGTEELFTSIMFELLAHLHGTAGGGSYPGICKYLAKQAQVLVQKYRSKSRRDDVIKEVETAAGRGDIATLNRAINAPDVDREDYSRFRAAFARYKALEQRARAATDVFSYREKELFSSFAEFQTMLALLALMGAAIYTFFWFSI
ncbi:MAG: protein kinase family protein [Alphaproteobacteria bacterium]|nr:protein kinase family protein [Alphaproteobacteria bacterium]